MDSIFLSKLVVVGDDESIENAAVVVSEGKVKLIAKQTDEAIVNLMKDPDVKVYDFKDQIIVPGFIDMHTHGGVGVDFIEPSLEKVERVAACLASEGVTSFCTSTMVLSPEDEKELLAKLGSYSDIKHARNLGIHLEGPHMNPKYHAMMDLRYLRNPNIEEMKENLALSQGRIKMITMAPELEGSLEFIKFCNDEGITVMIGHTDATAQQALDGLKAGAKGFTHLYNAMSPHVHRNPGVVTAALMSDGYCEFIVDGYHIDPKVVKVTYDAIGPDRIMLITDSMPGKKMADGLVEFGHQQCEVKDGKAFKVGSDRIAGSTIGMDDALVNMMEYTGCSLMDAVKMTSVNASKCLQVDDKIGSLHPGKFADMAVLNDDYKVVATFLEGNPTFLA